MEKVYERTENGVTIHVPIREALAEVNHAMMGGRKDVRRMASGRTQHSIEYKDGRLVSMRLVDAPAAEQEEWGTTTVSLLAHKFHGEAADYRAKCNRRIRWYARPQSQTEGPRLRTRSEIESVLFESGEPMYRLCPRCEKK